jgi:hypothetical protein
MKGNPQRKDSEGAVAQTEQRTCGDQAHENIGIAGQTCPKGMPPQITLLLDEDPGHRVYQEPGCGGNHQRNQNPPSLLDRLDGFRPANQVEDDRIGCHTDERAKNRGVGLGGWPDRKNKPADRHAGSIDDQHGGQVDL